MTGNGLVGASTSFIRVGTASYRARLPARCRLWRPPVRSPDQLVTKCNYRALNELASAGEETKEGLP